MDRQHHFAQQVIAIGMATCSALMLWQCLAAITNAESPIVVMVSSRIGPGIGLGDLLFITQHEEGDPLKVGDIVLFMVEGRELPIAHRVVRVHANNDEYFLLTKGDYNVVNDRGLYGPDQQWIERRHVLGRVKGYVPYVGLVTIILNNHPWVKYALLGYLVLLVLRSK